MDLKLPGYSKSEITIEKGSWEPEIDSCWYKVTYNIKNKYFSYNETHESFNEHELIDIFDSFRRYLKDKSYPKDIALSFKEPDVVIILESFYEFDPDTFPTCEYRIHLGDTHVSDYYTMILYEEQIAMVRDYIAEVMELNK